LGMIFRTWLLLVYLVLTEPLSAVALVPSTVKPQTLLETVKWMVVTVPPVTPALKDLAFSGYATVPVEIESDMPSTVQLLKARDVTVPIPAPLSPVPDLSVPVALDDVQVTVRPAVVSFRMVVPALPVIAPPGVTVQVNGAAACDAVALRPIVKATTIGVRVATLRDLRIFDPFSDR